MANDGFTFRRATPEDRDAVIALCAKIWEGDDYIPTCFDRWVADAEGELALCFAAGGDAACGAFQAGAADDRAAPAGPSLVGLAKLTCSAPERPGSKASARTRTAASTASARPSAAASCRSYRLSRAVASSARCASRPISAMSSP